MVLNVVLGKLRHSSPPFAGYLLLYAFGLTSIAMFLGANLGARLFDALNSQIVYTHWAGPVLEQHKLAELLQYVFGITALFFYYLLMPFFYSSSRIPFLFFYLKSSPCLMLAYLVLLIIIDCSLLIFFKNQAAFLFVSLLWAVCFFSALVSSPI